MNEKAKGALQNSNSLFAAMLHEKRPESEIEAQIIENNEALSSAAGQEWRDISSVAFPCAACGKIISRSPTSWCGQCNQPIFPTPPVAEPKAKE